MIIEEDPDESENIPPAVEAVPRSTEFVAELTKMLPVPPVWADSVTVPLDGAAI